MMGEIMKDFIDELRRAVFNKGMFISFIIAIVLNCIILKNYYSFSFYERFIKPWYESPSIISDGLYGGTVEWWTLLRATPYYVYSMYIFPMLAVFPYGSRLFFEKRTGQLKNQLIRQSRVRYAMKKYISIYVSGGIAVTLPLLVSLMVTYVVWPYHKTSQVNAFLANPDWFKKLYFSHTWAFILLTLFAWFIYGGILVSISIMFSMI